MGKFGVIRSNRRLFKLAIGIFAVLIFGLVLLPHLSRAADFSDTINVNYEVHSDGVTHVTETYNVTNQTTDKYLQSIQLATPTDDITNLAVEYTDGSNIPHSTAKKTTSQQGYSYDYQQVLVLFDRQNAGHGLRWSFVVSYDTTKLVESQGGAHTVYIPSIAENSNDHYRVSLSVPSTFGQLHTNGQKPTTDGTSNGQTKYSFDQLDLTKQSLALSFGDYTIYAVNFNFPLNNDSGSTKNFTVTLPPNMPSQKVYINSLDPQPQATHLDGDGNVLADYTVPAHTHWVVKTDIAALVKYLEYNLAASGTKADIPANLASQYTASAQYWQSNNPALAQKAHDIVQGKRTVAEQVRAVNDFVVNTLTYNNDKIKYNIRQGALKALQNPNNAVCLEYSDLTIALLRANGIPARMPIGYGYSGNLKQSNSVVDSLHSWVEAYVPGIGWMNVDPTWSEKFQNFGSSDLDHFAFAVWGQNDTTPAPVTENGEDTNYQYEDTTITYQQNIPQLPANVRMSASKYAILPFVSLVRYSVQAPQNNAADNYSLEISNGGKTQSVSLGSLAPAQKVSSMALSFGTGFLSGSNIKFVQTSDNSLVLANMAIPVNYLPLVVIAVLAGIIILLVIKSKATGRKQIAKQKQQEAEAIQRLHRMRSAGNKDSKKP